MNCIYNGVCEYSNTPECKPTCIRYVEMQYLLDTSNIPPNMQRIIGMEPDACDYDAFCKLADIKANIVDFADRGSNLYIVSEHTGNGKTTWAIKMLLKYFDKMWAGNGLRQRGAFISTPLFLSKCKDFGNVDEEFNAFKKNLTKLDLVVWDDIGCNGLSNYDLSQLMLYIDERILYGKSNIYTGNLLSKNLEEVLGSRLKSRIWDASIIVELRGKDRRNGTVADIFQDNSNR